MRTENLSLDFLQDVWIYETSHLCMWNVPQAHKCVTPEYLTRRFEKLQSLSGGRLWAAKPDDVIDYVLLRRNLEISNVRQQEGTLSFDVGGAWPIGVMNSFVTIRVSGAGFEQAPSLQQQFHRHDGGFAQHDEVQSVERSGSDWLLTMQLAPFRTVALSQPS